MLYEQAKEVDPIMASIKDLRYLKEEGKQLTKLYATLRYKETLNQE
jgi:hypothetical protein